MGLGNFLMRKSKGVVPGVNMRVLKACEAFDQAWLEDPLFRDILACAAQVTKTDIDIARLGSNSYLKRQPVGRLTIKDKNVKKLFEALEVDNTRLSEDGYINGVVRQLIEAEKHAKNNGEKSLADNAEHAVYVCSFVLARYILGQHPEYADRIAAIAPALKEAVK